MKLFYAFLFLFTGAQIFGQNNYYVSTSGSNSNPGTINAPWATIQHAAYNVVSGDVVNVRAGTYNEKVQISTSGTAANPIIFKSYNGENVIIDGTGISITEAILSLWDVSYIHIDGFKIRNNTMLDAIGILSEGLSAGIEIRNNEISNINWSSNPSAVPNTTQNAQPLIIRDTYSSNVINNIIIENNIVRDCRPGFSEALTLTGNVDGFEIRYNQVYNIQNIGIDVVGHYGTAATNDQVRNGKIYQNDIYNCKSPYATAAGIYVDGAKDINIERNRVYDNQWGIEVGCEEQGSTSGIQVINNLIYDNDDAGLAMGGYDYPNSGKVENCVYRNNTFYNNDKLPDAMGYYTGDIFLSYTENCTIENNIFFVTNPDNTAMYQYNASSFGYNFDYNIYYSATAGIGFEFEGTYYGSLSAYQSGSMVDVNSFSGNPNFVNAAIDDFQLNVGSPAIDAGNPSTILQPNELDYLGNVRIASSIIDIGASEYGSTGTQEYILDVDCIAITYEPDMSKVYITGDFTDKNITIVNASNSVIQNLNGLSSPIILDVSTLPSGQHFLVVEDGSDPSLNICDLIKQ